MSLLQIVRSATVLPMVTEDGDPLPLKLATGLSEAEIDELQLKLPCPIPGDVRELLRFCRGFMGGSVFIVDFNDPDAFGYDGFPHPHPVAADGCGNFWVADLLPESTHWGPIYYACHDPPIILYQAATLEEFLREILQIGPATNRKLIDDVHEDRLFNVWGKNPGVIEPADAVVSNDRVIREFAQELGPAFQIIDLRNAKPGMGFSWGRYGPRTDVRRCGTLPVWAYARPEKKPGLLGRLFGRR